MAKLKRNGMPDDPVDANAQLIAAAPELADALLRLMDACSGRLPQGADLVLADCRAALKKAGVLP